MIMNGYGDNGSDDEFDGQGKPKGDEDFGVVMAKLLASARHLDTNIRNDFQNLYLESVRRLVENTWPDIQSLRKSSRARRSSREAALSRLGQGFRIDHFSRTLKKLDLVRDAQAQMDKRLDMVTLSWVRRSFGNSVRESVKKKEKLLLAVVEKKALERLEASEFFRSHIRGQEGTLLQQPDKSRRLLAYIRNSVLKTPEHAFTASTALLDLLQMSSDGISQVDEYLQKLHREADRYNDGRPRRPPLWGGSGYPGYCCYCPDSLRSERSRYRSLEAGWGESSRSVRRSDSYFSIYTHNPCPRLENRKEEDDDEQYWLKFRSNLRSVEHIIEDELEKYKTAIHESHRYELVCIGDNLIAFTLHHGDVLTQDIIPRNDLPQYGWFRKPGLKIPPEEQYWRYRIGTESGDDYYIFKVQLNDEVIGIWTPTGDIDWSEDLEQEVNTTFA
ncbi:hypothetical protein BDZ45DRAFT_721601 [Acephala macrosclerotiorum]|nr:hypothetical protein BDZ45DRAFT_721601 [Acephala macrosclerotiorum]